MVLEQTVKHAQLNFIAFGGLLLPVDVVRERCRRHRECDNAREHHADVDYLLAESLGREVAIADRCDCRHSEVEGSQIQVWTAYIVALAIGLVPRDFFV